MSLPKRRLRGPGTARGAFRLAAAAAALEGRVAPMPDAALRDAAHGLKERAAAGETTDALMPLSFAIAREASRRILGIRPFDVQLAGAAVLHGGGVAEMGTGEGKTLVAMIAAHLEAIGGGSVHVITANDYLACRDATEAGRLLSFLGLRVGCVRHGMDDHDRRDAYAADVTYATAPEIGFDHLRDQTRTSASDLVSRPFGFAVVDEIDAVLIDEAGLPLILSGTGPDEARASAVARAAVAALAPDQWVSEERDRTAFLTEAGLSRVEAHLRRTGAVHDGSHLHDADGQARGLLAHVHQALRARAHFVRDRDYIVKDGRVLLVDRGTGRALQGRRLSDGLHQAIEAMEGLEIRPDEIAVASITYQNLFRLYPRLSGMTGTASAVADELAEIYGLGVVTLPPHRPCVRVDRSDEIHATSAARDAAAADIVDAAHRAGRPVLVGTSTVARSEALSDLFSRRGIPHSVLNAREAADEAAVIAQAGRPGAVTIATNMAGRGTDIRLGGCSVAPVDGIDTAAGRLAREEERRRDAVLARMAGGLLVIGTERHESTRIDHQLRGRAGRQGDPGETRFLLSLDDPLIARLGGTALARSLERGVGTLVSPTASRIIRTAQCRCEAEARERRRSLARYDDMPARQREGYFAWRGSFLFGADAAAVLESALSEIVGQAVESAMPATSYPEQWNAIALAAAASSLLGAEPPVARWMAADGADQAGVRDRILGFAAAREEALAESLGAEVFGDLQRHVLLDALDEAWREHLAEAEALRSGIGLRAYAQRDPLHEWNAECERLYARTRKAALDRAVRMLARMEPVAAMAG